MLKHEDLDKIRRHLLDIEKPNENILATLHQLNSIVVRLALDEHTLDRLIFCNMQREPLYNVTTWLIQVIRRVLMEIQYGRTLDDAWIVLAMCTWILQGVVIVDPWSLSMYGQEDTMRPLVLILRVTRHQKDIIGNVSDACSNALDIITYVTDARLENRRAFEQVEGLLYSVKLLKDKRLKQDLRIKVMELFYCYLLPEEGSQDMSVKSNITHNEQGLTVALEASTQGFVPETPHQERIVASRFQGLSRSVDEKKDLLRQVMPNAESLFSRFQMMEMAL